MSLIDRAGTFRGIALDRGMSVSSGGFPQFLIKCQALELYDEDEKVWVDWTPYEQNEITAFLILFDGKNNETLNNKQVQKVFNWDGADFQELHDIDIENLVFQFRVVESTYDNKTSLKVEWIDVADAELGRVIQKLAPDELKKLQAQYAKLLKPKKTVSAPAKAKEVAEKAKKLAKPKAPSQVPSMPEAPVDPNLPKGKCSKQEAWTTVVELRDSKVTDQKLSETWVEIVTKIAPNKTDTQITPEEWFIIRDKVLDIVSKL